MRIKKVITFIVALAMLLLFYVSFFSSPKVLAIHGSEANKELLVKTSLSLIAIKSSGGIIMELELYLPLKITMFQSGSLMGTIKSLLPRTQGLFQTAILITYYASTT